MRSGKTKALTQSAQEGEASFAKDDKFRVDVCLVPGPLAGSGAAGARPGRRRIWVEGRRQAAELKQHVVGGFEDVVMRGDSRVRESDEESGAGWMADRDVGDEAGATAGLFDNCGGCVVEEVHPAEADATYVAGVLEAGLMNEIVGIDVDGLCGGVLSDRTGAEKILEPECHVGGSGVDAGTGDGILGVGAGAFVVRA